MGTVITILAIVGCLLLFAITILKKKNPPKKEEEEWPYYAKKPLTEIEQVLYHRLVKAMPEHIILAQVQLSQILGVKKGHKFMEWHNKINRMSVDFLICQKDASVIAVIELDDKTHQKESRIKADNKKNKALNDAEIRLIRWKTNNLPDDLDLKQLQL